MPSLESLTATAKPRQIQTPDEMRAAMMAWAQM